MRHRFVVRGVLLAVAALSCSLPRASADLILGWEFNGNTGSEVSVNATTNLLGSPVAVTRGSGLTASALANAFSSDSWTNGGTVGNATANGEYFEFGFTVPDNYLLSLSTLDANFRRSGNGPSTFLWQYSLGGSFFDIGTNIIYTSSASTGTNMNDVLLSGITSLQNIAAGTDVTFRLLGASAGSSGTFAFGRLAGNDLSLDGTFTAVPEPGTMTLCGLGAAGMFGGRAWRRRRSEKSATTAETAR